MKDSSELEKLIRELDWNLLRTFMYIVQEGSITRAAQRLMLRQPSVSQALQRLEARLGTQLIDRSPAPGSSSARAAQTGQQSDRLHVRFGRGAADNWCRPWVRAVAHPCRRRACQTGQAVAPAAI